MKTRTRARSCVGKKGFTRNGALAFVLENRKATRFQEYHCSSCGRWHVGYVGSGLPRIAGGGQT